MCPDGISQKLINLVLWAWLSLLWGWDLINVFIKIPLLSVYWFQSEMLSHSVQHGEFDTPSFSKGAGTEAAGWSGGVTDVHATCSLHTFLCWVNWVFFASPTSSVCGERVWHLIFKLVVDVRILLDNVDTRDQGKQCSF